MCACAIVRPPVYLGVFDCFSFYPLYLYPLSTIHYLYPLSTIHYLYPLSTILIVHRRLFPKTPYSFKNMLIFYLCSQCLHRTSISMPRIKTNLVLYIPLLASRGLILPLYRPNLYNYVCIILYLAGKWLPGVHRKGT